MQIAEEAPFLFFEDIIPFSVDPDSKPTATGDTVSVFPTDAWVLQQDLDSSSTTKLNWEEGRNWNDLMMLLVTSIYSAKRIINPSQQVIIDDLHPDRFDQSSDISQYSFVSMMIILSAFIKVNSYLRTFESQGRLVLLLTQCLQDVIPFTMFFFLW